MRPRSMTSIKFYATGYGRGGARIKMACAVRGPGAGRVTFALTIRYFVGAMTIVIWRPSIFGCCSTFASSSVSSRTLFSSFMPSS